MPFVNASVTGPVVNLATHAIGSLGLGGVAVMMAMSNVVAVPGTEVTMLFGGFNTTAASHHHLSIVGVIVAGALGDLVGATIAYWIGYRGRKELVSRYGHRLHLTAERVERAGQRAARIGGPAILLSRLLPGGRFVFPYAVGIIEMSYVRFIAFAAAGSAIWATGLAFLGKAVGHNWPSWRNHLEYVDYAILALIVLGLVWIVLRRLRGSRRSAVDALAD